VRDHEDPGAEAGLVAFEVAQPADDRNEDLRGQVLGLPGAVRTQVAGDRGGHLSVQGRPSPRRARAGRIEDFAENRT
jgi:hypothetical protein